MQPKQKEQVKEETSTASLGREDGKQQIEDERLVFFIILFLVLFDLKLKSEFACVCVCV